MKKLRQELMITPDQDLINQSDSINLHALEQLAAIVIESDSTNISMD